ncbi:MAG: hypothetical protein CL912_30175 [Deltaproteobacteria bacterium]|nr:hypothetical protein [Deltaproteobacteria bacterium]
MIAQVFFAFRNPATSLRHSVSYIAFEDEPYRKEEPEFDDCLFLPQLAVAPDAQRKGVGRKLVQWGLDIVEREQIPAVLYATTQGRPLYDAMGFREIEMWQYSKGKENLMAIMKYEGNQGSEVAPSHKSYNLGDPPAQY